MTLVGRALDKSRQAEGNMSSRRSSL